MTSERVRALRLWMQPMRRLPTAALVVVSAGIVAGALVVVVALDVDADTDVLGTVVIQVEQAASSETYGYLAGGFGFGQIVSGEWPGALFTDGSPRAVESVRETPAGWFLGAENTDDALEDVVLVVAYEDGKNSRRFHMAGFIAERTAAGLLKLNPPIQSRDWDVLDGQTVTLSFSRAPDPVVIDLEPAPALVDPVAEANTLVEFIARTTPGGGVVAQGLIVIVVYLLYALKASATPWGIMGGAVVLVCAPWVPVALGFGSPLAAAILLMNTALGSYAWKAWLARQAES